MHAKDATVPLDGNVEDDTTQSLYGNLEVENVTITCEPSKGQNFRSMNHDEEIIESQPKKAKTPKIHVA
jgi:hypothetical protein